MKHFIFTSILPDDGVQHTNVETNMEMEVDECYAVEIMRISRPSQRTRETLISNLAQNNH